MPEGKPPPALLILSAPADLRHAGGPLRGRGRPAGGAAALRLVVQDRGRVCCWVDAEGAAGIVPGEDGRHPQVRREPSRPGVSQGALLRHLGSQVGADPRRVGVDQDPDPDDRARLTESTEEVRTQLGGARSRSVGGGGATPTMMMRWARRVWARK